MAKLKDLTKSLAKGAVAVPVALVSAPFLAAKRAISNSVKSALDTINPWRMIKDMGSSFNANIVSDAFKDVYYRVMGNKEALQKRLIEKKNEKEVFLEGLTGLFETIKENNILITDLLNTIYKSMVRTSEQHFRDIEARREKSKTTGPVTKEKADQVLQDEKDKPKESMLSKTFGVLGRFVKHFFSTGIALLIFKMIGSIITLALTAALGILRIVVWPLIKKLGSVALASGKYLMKMVKSGSDKIFKMGTNIIKSLSRSMTNIISKLGPILKKLPSLISSALSKTGAATKSTGRVAGKMLTNTSKKIAPKSLGMGLRGLFKVLPFLGTAYAILDADELGVDNGPQDNIEYDEDGKEKPLKLTPEGRINQRFGYDELSKKEGLKQKTLEEFLKKKKSPSIDPMRFNPTIPSLNIKKNTDQTSYSDIEKGIPKVGNIVIYNDNQKFEKVNSGTNNIPPPNTTKKRGIMPDTFIPQRTWEGA